MTESHSNEIDSEQRRQFWKEHIERWQQDSLSQTAYCHQFNLKPHQFTYWKKRLAQADRSVTFIPLQRSEPMSKISQTGLNLFTPNGYRIEVAARFDIQALKQLISVVQSL